MHNVQKVLFDDYSFQVYPFFSQKTFWHTIMEKMVKKINVGKHAEQQELIQMVELNNISVTLENFLMDFPETRHQSWPFNF